MTFSNVANPEQRWSVVFPSLTGRFFSHSLLPLRAYCQTCFRASCNCLTISLSWRIQVQQNPAIPGTDATAFGGGHHTLATVSWQSWSQFLWPFLSLDPKLRHLGNLGLFPRDFIDSFGQTVQSSPSVFTWVLCIASCEGIIHISEQSSLL